MWVAFSDDSGGFIDGAVGTDVKAVCYIRDFQFNYSRLFSNWVNNKPEDDDVGTDVKVVF